MILRPPPSPAYVAYVAAVELAPAYSVALLLEDAYAAGAGCEKLGLFATAGAFCRVLGIFFIIADHLRLEEIVSNKVKVIPRMRMSLCMHVAINSA